MHCLTARHGGLAGARGAALVADLAVLFVVLPAAVGALALHALAAGPCVAGEPGVASALGARSPLKRAAAPLSPASTTAQAPDRQGGDTLADAVPLVLPVFDLAGTTAGYTDDYDEACPYLASTSPDVVYSFVPTYDLDLEIDLCGSAYDTKVYVYDQDLALLACNDDFYAPGHPCGSYVSRIASVPVQAGETCYVVVDGYGGDWGDYVLDIHVPPQCWIECPAGAEVEGEPPLAVDYIDLFNGGCNSDGQQPVLQPITGPLFCGISGWYAVAFDDYRDTDWFVLEIPASGVLEVTGDAEQECFMFELAPQDCDAVSVVQTAWIGPCLPATLTMSGAPGDTIWFWVGPTTFSAPGPVDVFEFSYLLETNLETVVSPSRTWTEVRALFR